MARILKNATKAPARKGKVQIVPPKATTIKRGMSKMGNGTKAKMAH